MIDWWGPILFEFYSMTEGFGAASIFSDEWLRRPGSVGRPLMGMPHVVGLDGAELPPGEVGTVFFEGGTRSEYHGDPGKTAAAANERGWRTVGDVGYLDHDGRTDANESGTLPNRFTTLSHSFEFRCGLRGEPGPGKSSFQAS